MKAVLVAMPWAEPREPSAALGVLAAYLRREAPEVELEVRYDYLSVAESLGDAVYLPISTLVDPGELLYLALLYPEHRDRIRVSFDTLMSDHQATTGREIPFYETLGALERHLERLAHHLAGGTDLLGLTTTVVQTFSSLALAQRVRSLSPETRVVLGGYGVTHEKGQLLLREYPFIDYAVPGEGERPLLQLVRALRDAASTSCIPGLIGRDGSSTHAAAIAPDLGSLPAPDYDEYARDAERLGLNWYLGVEPGRGCYWDRVDRKGDPQAKCAFCDYPTRHPRTKPVELLVGQMRTLANRYRKTRFKLNTNAVWPPMIHALRSSLAAESWKPAFGCAVRADVRPDMILDLVEAGMESCFCGVEAFSTPLLARIGKGTSAAHNLQVIKTCHELDVQLEVLLMVDFPGATEEDVRRTLDVIQRHARCFNVRARAVRFTLKTGSVVDRDRERFGVHEVRNLDVYRAALPEEVWRRLRLADQSYAVHGKPAQWDGVVTACHEWQALHRRLCQDRLPRCYQHPLYYREGPSFLEIVDRRQGYRRLVLEGIGHEAFRFCLRLRSSDAIAQRFAERTPEALRVLQEFGQQDLVFIEDERYLSLAVAVEPASAAARIRRETEAD